jgi:Lysyl oxidase
MLSRVLVLRVLPVAIAVTLCVGGLTAAGFTGAAAGGPARLPDLDQATPSELVISRDGPRSRPVYRLGFRSAVSNFGDGPLVINGHRSGLDTAGMSADQLIERDGAPQEVVPGVGELRFVVSADHRHWHLLRFERYELRRAGRGEAAVSDRKTGFCLGDRYAVRSRSLPAAPAAPVYTSRCGLADPGLLGIQEGISVGYGDDYAANLEGQYLPLTGLPAGRYVLVHRVNRDRRLRELDYTNNAASLLLELRWRNRQPVVRVLRKCPETDRCDRRLARVLTVALVDPALRAQAPRRRRVSPPGS